MYLSAFFQKTLFLVPNVGMLMQDTVILKNEEKLIRHLLGFLNNRTSLLKLCYRASLHGWSCQQFHQQCDGKVNTVVLVKVGNYIFGGYTDQTWQGENLTKLFLMHLGLSTIHSTYKFQNLFEKHRLCKILSL